MTEITEDVEVRVATETAQLFIEAYYNALTQPGARQHLTNFYVTPSAVQTVDITMNGTPISSPSALQDIFTKQVGRCQYDVQSYDVHVTNKDYRIGRPEGLSEKGGGEGRRLSLLVTVSGVAKFGTEESGLGEARAFSDVVFLVPNWSSFGGKGGNIKARKWVIQNQTFRVVV